MMSCGCDLVGLWCSRGSVALQYDGGVSKLIGQRNYNNTFQ